MIPLETLETMPPMGVSLLGFQDGGPESPRLQVLLGPSVPREAVTQPQQRSSDGVRPNYRVRPLRMGAVVLGPIGRSHRDCAIQ
jgi:hypothetical protein